MVAPVLSLTGIPTAKPPAVALASAPVAVLADGGADLPADAACDESAGAASADPAIRAVAVAISWNTGRIGVSRAAAAPPALRTSHRRRSFRSRVGYLGAST